MWIATHNQAQLSEKFPLHPKFAAAGGLTKRDFLLGTIGFRGNACQLPKFTSQMAVAVETAVSRFMGIAPLLISRLVWKAPRLIR